MKSSVAPPLTGTLLDNPLREFIRTFGLVERVMQPYFARYGISGAQWGVLRNLHRAEQEGCRSLRLSELSDRLLIRPASVTGLIDRLERSELVRRTGSPTDLRAKQVQLTRAGRQLLRRILAAHEGQISTVLAGLSAPDQAELHRLLIVWRGHLERLLAGETPPPESSLKALAPTG
jgi:DNA-binding MarR family transcriptional regulator